MRTEYTLTAEDIDALVDHLLSHRHRWQIRIGSIACAGIVATIAYLSTELALSEFPEAKDVPISGIFAAILGFVVLPAYPSVIRNSTKKRFRSSLSGPQSISLGPHTATLSSLELTIAGPNASTTLKTSTIESVTQTSTHLFVNLYSNTTIPIPVRTLAPSDRAALLEALQSARRTTPPID